MVTHNDSTAENERYIDRCTIVCDVLRIYKTKVTSRSISFTGLSLHMVASEITSESIKISSQDLYRIEGGTISADYMEIGSITSEVKNATLSVEYVDLFGSLHVLRIYR